MPAHNVISNMCSAIENGARLVSHGTCSSTIPPLAQLTMRTPFFIFLMVASFTKCFVSGVSGVWIVMKSACAQIWSRKATS